MTRDQAEQLLAYHKTGFDVHYRGSLISVWREDDPDNGGYPIVRIITQASACLDHPYCLIPVQALEANDFMVYSHSIVDDWLNHE